MIGLLLTLACHRGETPQEAACAVAEPPPRQLRLLTRREFDHTVSDLFRLDEARTCDDHPDCAIDHELCVSGTCEADPCSTITFLFAANGDVYDSVHVAGTFNGWSPTVAGGYAMQYIPDQDLWYAKAELDDGEYAYKFVVNEQDWYADPNNPRTTPDGYGGDNSVLTVDCADAPSATWSVSADFPNESRPEGYAFDNNAAAGLVTSVHVEQYLRAARTLVEQALRDPDALLGCDYADPACAEDFLLDFVSRAFRRPLSSAESGRYLAILHEQSDPLEGLSIAMQVALNSPYFLYRAEVGSDIGDGLYRLNGYETASALSYFFWGTMPDEALMAAAAAGELDTPEGIEVQARRLLDDPRARSTVGVFAEQWLGVERLSSMDKNAALYPAWDTALAASMREETRRFVTWVVFDGGHTYGDLLRSTTTFADQDLASLYGVSGVGAGEWAQIQTPSGQRSGLLGQAGILASTAHSDQSSPIRRGLFVRQTLLCQSLGSPPPNAGGVPEVDPDATTRERFAQHTADPGCSSCHQYIDGVGFGFEGFDAIGAWRTLENGVPIDTSGDMNDVEGLGTDSSAPYHSLPELAEILASSDAAPTCFTRQVYRFSRGALEESGGECTVLTLEERFAAAGFDLRELLIAAVTEPDFVLRRAEP